MMQIVGCVVLGNNPNIFYFQTKGLIVIIVNHPRVNVKLEPLPHTLRPDLNTLTLPHTHTYTLSLLHTHTHTSLANTNIIYEKELIHFFYPNKKTKFSL